MKEDALKFTFTGSDQVYYLQDGKIIDEKGQELPPETQRHILARYFASAAKELLSQGVDVEKVDNALKTGEDEHLMEIIRSDMQKAADVLKRANDLIDYLEDELKKPKYHGESIETLLKDRQLAELADESDPKTAVLLQALDAIEKRFTQIKRPDLITTPLDKVSTKLFNLSLPANVRHARLDIETTAHKKNAPATHVKALLYFDDDITKKYSLSKELTAFDKLTASAIYSIYRENHDAAGHCITTLNSIHKSINKSNATASQLERYRNSMLKQSLTRIQIDNRQEAETYGYETFNRGSAALLEMREIDEVITRNGKITDGYIEILAEPPALAFSVANGHQLTDIPAEVFKSGISQTDKNLTIQDYLIRRIAPEKNKLRDLMETQAQHYTLDRQKKIRKAQSVTIQTKTLLTNTGRGEDRKDKARALETAMKYLNHFTSVNWIQSAKLARDKSKILIVLSN